MEGGNIRWSEFRTGGREDIPGDREDSPWGREDSPGGREDSPGGSVDTPGISVSFRFFLQLCGFLKFLEIYLTNISSEVKIGISAGALPGLMLDIGLSKIIWGIFSYF